MNSFVHHPFVILLTALEASGSLFGLLGAMVSELLSNLKIYANKVTLLLLFLSFASKIDSLRLKAKVLSD